MRVVSRIASCWTLVVASAVASAADDAERRAELERAFQETMSGAELVGYFVSDGVEGDQQLHEDTYTIQKVTKMSGDLWRFDARVRYGQVDVTAPIPLQVKWAGDTPVITLTDLAIPGLGTYTARVLVYRGHYAGTWSGGDHGGKMFGRIVRAPEPGEESGAGDEAKPRDTPREETGANWPSFRGPRSTGVAGGPPPPAEWDVEDGTNIRFRTPIPGLAHSSPVIWGDRLFVSTAVREEGESELKVGLYGNVFPVKDEGVHSFRVYCLDKYTGEILWSKTAVEAEPEIERHPKGSHAASSPATDGRHVVACFGSEGTYCYDTDGELLWSKDLGVLDSGFFRMPEAQWGFASSPIIHDGRVILQVDVQENSFLAAFDVKTGKELWRTPRQDVPTWSTPALYRHDGDLRIAVNGWKHIGGYDFETGEEVWKLVGGGDIPVPTPVVGHGLIYITNAHGSQAPIYAIPVGAESELEPEALPWSKERRGNYMQTPILYGDELYLCSDGGVVACYDAKTGEEHYRERIGTGNRRSAFTASPVAAGGRLYWTGEQGEVYVVAAGPEFAVIGENLLGETCLATPAISEGTIYFRTRGHVVAVGSEASGG